MLQTLLYGVSSILATVALVMGVYFGTRRLLGPSPSEQTSTLAASVLFRISALHGLVLALVFAAEMAEYQSLDLETTREANAIADLYNDAQRYGTDAAPGIRALVRDYLDLAAGAEWQELGRTGTLVPGAWATWAQIYEAVLDLEPDTTRRTDLRDHMLDQVHAIAELRDLRAHHATTRTAALFWIAAIGGVVLVAASYYTFLPDRPNLILISIVAAYTGLIMFTIYALENPYSLPTSLQPVSLQDLIARIEGAPDR